MNSYIHTYIHTQICAAVKVYMILCINMHGMYE
jgi:hypothetical protein